MLHTCSMSSWFHPAASSIADHSPTLLSSQGYHSTATAHHHIITRHPLPSTTACCCPSLSTPPIPPLQCCPPPPSTTHHHLPPPHGFFPHRCLPTTTCRCTTTLLSPDCLSAHHGLAHHPSPSITSRHHQPLSANNTALLATLHPASAAL